MQHPLDPTRVPGGSSGGSAALVAAGVVPAALGSETGGSVRQPASFCGVVGVKPTYGRVSRYGLVAFGSSLDSSRCSAGRWTTPRRVLERHQRARSARCHDASTGRRCRCRRPRPTSRGIAIGLPREYFPADLDPGVARRAATAPSSACESSARRCATCRCRTRARDADLLHRRARRGGGEPGALRRRALRAAAHRPDGDIRALYQATRGEGFGAEVPRRILLGTYVLSAGYYDAYYRKAQQVRALIADDFRRRLRRGVDLLFTPTTPTPAFQVGEKTDDPVAMYLTDIFVCAVEPRRPAGDVPADRPERGAAGRRPAHRAALRRGAACSPPPRRSSGRSPAAERRCADGLGDGHRARGPRAAQDADARCSAAARPTSALRPTPTSARSVSGCPGALPVLNAEAVQLARAGRARARLHGARDAASSPGRTTSIPICPRATRSRSSTSRSPPAAA